MKIIKSDDTWGNRIAWTIVKFKQRYDRGTGWLAYPKSFVGIIAEISIILIILEKYGIVKIVDIPFSVFAFILISYIAMSYIIGYTDEVNTWSLWKRELIRATTVYNPVMREMSENVKEIKAWIKEHESICLKPNKEKKDD